MYVDSITRQTYDYATPITCDNNPRTIIELDPDSDDQDFYILGPEPIKRKPPLMITPSQSKTTIRPNFFTAQDAGIFSNAELDQFWNRILFSKHSDSTLQLLGKALSNSFISSNTPEYDANSPHDNPYNTLRITLFSSIAHDFFNVLTAQKINDLNDTQNKKPKNTLFKSKSLDNFTDTSTHLINHSTGITSPPLFYTKRSNKLHIPKFKLFPTPLFSPQNYSSNIYTSFFF